MAGKKYKVTFTMMVDRQGNNRQQDEIVEEADIPEVAQQVEIGAIVEASADEVKADDEKKASAKKGVGGAPSPAVTTGNQAGGVDQIAGEKTPKEKGK